jgi:hypothetical protein
MSEPLPRIPVARAPASARPARRRLVVPHPPIGEEKIAPFASWIDAQLVDLESRLRHLMTPHSLKASLRQ